MDRQRRRLVGLEQDFEAARCDMVVHLIEQGAHDAVASRRKVDRGVTAVRGEPRLERDSFRSRLTIALQIERPLARSGKRREEKRVMLLQVLRPRRTPAPREIVGCRDDDAPRLAESSGDERRVFERSDANRDVDAFVDEMQIAIVEDELRRDVGVRGKVVAQ